MSISLNEILLAFLGGFVNYIAPCFFLVLTASWLFFFAISNTLYSENKKNLIKTVSMSSSLVFIGLAIGFMAGAYPSKIQKIVMYRHDVLTKTSALVIIYFGLYFLESFKLVKIFNKKYKFLKKQLVNLSYVLLGVSFAVAWTHCITPILGLIIQPIAQNPDNAAKGLLLLVTYSAGLFVPYILSSVAASFLVKRVAFLRSLIFRAINGILLTTIGIALFIEPVWNQLSKIFIGFTSNSTSNRLEIMLIRLLKF